MEKRETIEGDNTLLKQQNEGIFKEVAEFSVFMAKLEARTAEAEKQKRTFKGTVEARQYEILWDK